MFSEGAPDIEKARAELGPAIGAKRSRLEVGAAHWAPHRTPEDSANDGFSRFRGSFPRSADRVRGDKFVSRLEEDV
jgi:hypothetical protein